VAAELGIHEHTVGKWRRRFLKDRCDGLLDEARPGRPRTINDDQVAEVIERTLRTTPPDPTHWSIRSMAAETGFSHTTIRRMWTAFGLQPHRSQTFKLSSDPLFVDKVRDVVGFTYRHRTEPLFSASMRRVRYRHSIASNRSCQ
jgi:transposase